MADHREDRDRGHRGRSNSIFGSNESSGRDHPQSWGEANSTPDNDWLHDDDRQSMGRGASSAGQGGSRYGQSQGSGQYSQSGGGYTGSGAGYGNHPDEHYHNWRDQQIAQFDRDYDEYRRERQQQFHSDFDSWRRNRQGAGATAGQGMSGQQGGATTDPAGGTVEGSTGGEAREAETAGGATTGRAGRTR